MWTVFRPTTVDMELSNSRDITISTCGGIFDCHRWIFYSRPHSSFVYIHILRVIILYTWRADSPRRKRLTEGPDYFCEAPTPKPPQFPRYSHCRCAQIILFGPSCKSAAVWFMPNNTRDYLVKRVSNVAKCSGAAVDAFL